MGWGGRREAQEGGDICICITDSLCCKAEINIILLSNYLLLLFVVSKSYLIVCSPVDYSLPGSSVHGILHARILKWVAMTSSRGSSQPRDQTQVSPTAGGFLTTEPPEKPRKQLYPNQEKKIKRILSLIHMSKTTWTYFWLLRMFGCASVTKRLNVKVA